ncbi:hypothetical protein WR25_01531 [Diploscapter pachys]|uniref:Clc-like protein n=1 Tax=Diploscapter pachys TaxID=2018661 RepID=A0A2A2J282_9BILA|nr:hypothetical protein WR25_01531 [Diploscapter pachys]
MGIKAHGSRTVVIVISLVLLVIAFGLSAAGIMSPSWQVVDLREFQSVHHHGLWLDCTRQHLLSLTSSSSSHRVIDEQDQPLHCTYKFDHSAAQIIDENINDVDQNSAAGESEHHQFYGWHKATLLCMVCALTLLIFALVSGMCAPCTSSCAVLFAVFAALAVFMSFVGDCIFFFAAHRVDSRFVTGLVATYEQAIGIAFYMHIAGTLIAFLAFIMSSLSAYQMLRTQQYADQTLPLRY